MVSIELFLWIVLVKLVSGILELVFLVYYIHRYTLILRLVCSQSTKQFKFVKMTGTIKKEIVDSIIIFLTTYITTTKSDWVTTDINQI